MKSQIICLFAWLFTINPAYTQAAKNFFESDELVWYGLDFSQAKMVGGDFGAQPWEIKDRFFREWNYVVLDQPEKFNLPKFFRKTSVYKDLAPVEARNKGVDEKNLMSYNETQLNNDDIAKAVKQYKGGDKKEGTGLVFIVENFNKPAKRATVWVTFFDIATKKVLLAKKMSAEPMGYGMRNYWIGAIYRIMTKINEKEYNNWRSEYGK
jgi:hypothetical protein